MENTNRLKKPAFRNFHAGVRKASLHKAPNREQRVSAKRKVIARRLRGSGAFGVRRGVSNGVEKNEDGQAKADGAHRHSHISSPHVYSVLKN